MFIIEDIPMTQSMFSSRGQHRLYPFPDLKPGQSFLVPKEKAHAASAAGSAYRRDKSAPPGWDYASRKEAGGVRFYRVDKGS